MIFSTCQASSFSKFVLALKLKSYSFISSCLPPKINMRARLAWGSCRSVVGLLTLNSELLPRERWPPEWYEEYYSINGKFHSVLAALQPVYFQGMQTFQALKTASYYS